MSDRRSHLRVYAFGPGGGFEGRLAGVLERSGAVRILDALFVLADPDSGEVHAIDLATGTADGTLARLLDFRLGAGSRSHTTQRTLAHAGDAIDAMRPAVQPGGALLAVVLAGEAVWPDLEDAVSGSGGRPVGDVAVDDAAIARLAPQLTAVLAGS